MNVAESENMNVEESENINVEESENIINIYSDVIGYVKWFNSKKGYGFLSIVIPNHELKDTDIFCHFSNINTLNHKILYPGEYVSFNISKNKDEQFICNNVTGVYGNNLLTDNTKYFYRVSQNKKDSNQ